MPWEYLSSKPLDVRFLFAAGYLQCHRLIEGMQLVDLNCGTARLLHYIPHNFRSYTGNDIHQKPGIEVPQFKFWQLPDAEMPGRLRGEHIDVLMAFGLADARSCKSRWESGTSGL